MDVSAYVLGSPKRFGRKKDKIWNKKKEVGSEQHSVENLLNMKVLILVALCATVALVSF